MDLFKRLKNHTYTITHNPRGKKPFEVKIVLALNKFAFGSGKTEKEALTKALIEESVDQLGFLLQINDFDGGLEFVRKEILPTARKKRIPLWVAAENYADQDADQDTSYFQLFHALQRINNRTGDRIKFFGLDKSFWKTKKKRKKRKK